LLAEKIVGHVLKSTVLIELLQTTHLNDYREAVVLLVEGSSDPRNHDEVNAVGEGRSSCPTYARPLFFVQYT
jgi:hypothetical protein